MVNGFKQKPSAQMITYSLQEKHKSANYPWKVINFTNCVKSALEKKKKKMYLLGFISEAVTRHSLILMCGIIEVS